MPTQLLLDGDDLPALMLRVRSELGPDAVVVKAERVRTGGVAGFFAKEHFEVTVEVPDAPPSGRRARPLDGAGAAGGLQALLDAADASDGDRAGPSDQHAAPVSTEGDTFAALLASIDGMAGTLPAPRRSQDQVPSEGVGTTSAADVAAVAGAAAAPFARFADTGATVTAAAFGPLLPAPAASESVALPEPGTPDRPSAASAASAVGAEDESTLPAQAAARAPGGPAVQPATFARVPVGTMTTRDGGETRAAGTAPAVADAASPAPVSAPTVDDPTAQPVTASDPGPGSGPVPVTAAPGVETARSVDTASRPEPAEADTAARRALLAVGVPGSLLDGTDTAVAPASLADAVAGFPRPPALLRAPGSLVAVVGEGADVVAAAREIARRAGIDPRDVALAGDLRPADATDREVLTLTTAPRQRSRTSTLGAVTVVAVAVGPERADRAAAAALVAELDPDQMWAVVDARRKAADLRAWMRQVAGGRRFAGVAAARVEETCEPGTLLDLAVPVGWLDGLPATPVVWAAVLGEHLDADADRG